MHPQTRVHNLTRMFTLFLAIVVPNLARLIGNSPITATLLAYSLVNAAILTGFLAWLIPRVHLRRWSLALLVWLELLVVGYLNNYVEGLYYTTLSDKPGVLVYSVVGALVSSALWATFGAILFGQGTSSITTSLEVHFSRRSRSSWIWRILIASAAYFPIYFFFGALISPFVLPYYSSVAFGLRIPPFTVIVPLELFRGFVYTLVLLPLLAATVGSRTTKLVALAATLYVPGGLIALLGNQLMPPQIIPFHALEILADSIAYALVLSRLLSRPERP